MRAQMGDFLSIESVLGAAKEREDRIQNECKSKLDEIKRLQESYMSLEQHLRALKEVSGLNRISLTTSKGACRDSNICRQLYGFDDFDFMIDFLEAAFEIKYVEPTRSTTTTGKGNNLSDVEQCLLTLLYTNTNWGFDIIGMLFGVGSKTTVSSYINKWLPLRVAI